MAAPSYSLPPEHAKILIIGGGPAGSYAASVLAREGIPVVLFEAAKFPREHIGESLIPSIRPYMRFIDAEDKLVSAGFVRKPGSTIKFNQWKREGYTDFVALGHEHNSWNVTRPEFDQLLLNHARSCGVAVYEQTKVTSLSFSATDPSQPVSAIWKHTPLPSPPSLPTTPIVENGPSAAGEPNQAAIGGSTSFDFVIDATGRSGIMSTQYLKNRQYNQALKNIAIWGYWENTNIYGKGTEREGSPWFEALTDESGWAWFIPLGGVTSVGVVINQEMLQNRQVPSRAYPAPLDSLVPLSTTERQYLDALVLTPGLVELLTPNGHLRFGSVKKASDYSYAAPSYAGRSYRIIGDAGAFIDPLFSSGIHLAMTSALSAAASICASIRGDCDERVAADWHSQRVTTSYTRFQIVVLSAYKQIRAQSFAVLSDIDEDNFDRAFAALRPIIQGAGDMGSRLSEDELQRCLNFCLNLFHPTTPEVEQRARVGVAKELLDVTQPVMGPDAFTDALNVHVDYLPEDREFLDKINARRVIHSEYSVSNLCEVLNGFGVRLNRGTLGLVPVH